MNDDTQNYVNRLHQDSRRVGQELLRENERLRSVAASLESECRHLEGEVARHSAERQHLIEQLHGIEQESRRLAEQYVEIEQQNSNLANLYVASYRLHSTLDREEVIAGIQEIIINLIGSEEIAIFELSADCTSLELLASFGIDEQRLRRVRVGEGIIGGAAATGELFLPADAGAPMVSGEPVTACIPLTLDGRVTGVIAVFRLLQQKNGLEAIDRELFQLLATHAAMALYCTAVAGASAQAVHA